ncbi:MAG TPA: Rieske 2Fe-2S domain-containing protein [Gaiellaceae bacterium]|nr:Rieske 2Fe-2S domain-containing protein [Gaiellaceae bacterium]
MIGRLKDLLVALAVLLLGRRRPGGDPEAERIVPPGSPDRRAEAWVLALFGLATAGSIAFLVVYALDPLAHRTQLLGVALGVALAALGAACLVIATRLVVTEELEEPYPAEHVGDQDAVAQLVAESGDRITRRRLLTLGGAAAGGTLGLALLAPALAVGPVFDTDELAKTPWRRGRALVDEAGRRIAADAIEEEAFYTAFPEGADRETVGAPLVVVRLSPDALHLPPERRGWAPEGIVAYSKICTHAGCAIALYRKPTFPAVEPRPAFVCPCHYSTFDPATGGTVLFGPAGRALPQLPLLVDRSGNLRAAGNFSGPVGPSWWGVRSRKARGA